MNGQIQEIISLLLGMTGLLSFVGGIFFWFKSNVEKRYAAERDFQHIRNDYKSLVEFLKIIDDDLEEQDRTLLEMKSSLSAITNRLEILTIKLSDGSTSGYPRQ